MKRHDVERILNGEETDNGTIREKDVVRPRAFIFKNLETNLL